MLASAVHVGGGLVVDVADLTWAAYSFLLFLAFFPAALVKSNKPLVGWVVLGLSWCADQCYTLATGETSPALFNLICDALPFVWFVTREDFGSRLFGAMFAVMLPLHFDQIMGADPDTWAYWWQWTAFDFTQLALLLVWCRAAGCGRG